VLDVAEYELNFVKLIILIVMLFIDENKGQSNKDKAFFKKTRDKVVEMGK